MRSHPVGLDVWILVWPFVYFHTSCLRTAKALARPPRRAGSPEPSLVAYMISTTISWAGSFIFPEQAYNCGSICILKFLFPWFSLKKGLQCNELKNLCDALSFLCRWSTMFRLQWIAEKWNLLSFKLVIENLTRSSQTSGTKFIMHFVMFCPSKQIGLI